MRAAAILVALALLAPVASADALTRDEFEATLARLQQDVDAARTLYAEGDAEKARTAAARAAAEFEYGSGGASPLELAIKDASAIAIGDRVKALTARLHAAIDAGAPVAEVDAIADDLSPSLNRLVLVAQGKATAASQRSLKTVEDVDAAVAEVNDLVDQAVRLAERGERADAVAAAKDAFFAFEINGLGPDTSTVDDDLENYAENLVVNFDTRTVESHPGLSQLIEGGASAADVNAHADVIRAALGEVAELLKATLPPVSLGDANGDAKVTIVDALLVAQAALGVRPTTSDMDVNGDGKVSIVDALLIAQAALGIRSL